MAQAGRIAWTNALYEAKYLDGATLAFAATDKADVNAQIVADAQERGVPVNSASGPDAGDFVTPAPVRRGPLILTVSTEGGSPRCRRWCGRCWKSNSGRNGNT